MIGIVDIGIGNLGSVREAIHALGNDPVSVGRAADLEGLSHLILPGVGAFSHAVRRLHDTGLFGAIRQYASDGRPLLGICLGMQLLADIGDEDGPSDGLGLIGGRVSLIAERDRFRVPHVGWNEMRCPRPHPVLKGVRQGVDFYFVHSYEFQPTRRESVLGVTDHGKDIVCAVGQGSALGLQFHPEKSQKNGLRLLENFCDWDGRC